MMPAKLPQTLHREEDGESMSPKTPLGPPLIRQEPAPHHPAKRLVLGHVFVWSHQLTLKEA